MALDFLELGILLAVLATALAMVKLGSSVADVAVAAAKNRSNGRGRA